MFDWFRSTRPQASLSYEERAFPGVVNEAAYLLTSLVPDIYAAMDAVSKRFDGRLACSEFVLANERAITSRTIAIPQSEDTFRTRFERAFHTLFTEIAGASPVFRCEPQMSDSARDQMVVCDPRTGLQFLVVIYLDKSLELRAAWV